MSLHVFLGEEDLLIDEGVRRLIDATLSPEAQALNLDVVNAGSTAVPDLLARLDTLPFFGDARVVVVKDVDALGTDEQRTLANYLERGTPPTVAVFTARALDRRGRLFKVLQRGAEVHACDRLAAREVPAWAARRAAGAGKRLTGAAAAALAAQVGTGLRIVALEVDKLASYVGDRPDITPADVEAIASRTSEATVFHLADAIGERQLGRAMQALEGLLVSEHPLPLFGMIARQFRMLLRARVALARREKDLARAVGVHPYVAGKLARQAPRYRLEDFPRIFAELEETDRALKSTGRPALALEMLVARLCAVSVR